MRVDSGAASLLFGWTRDVAVGPKDFVTERFCGQAYQLAISFSVTEFFGRSLGPWSRRFLSSGADRCVGPFCNGIAPQQAVERKAVAGCRSPSDCAVQVMGGTGLLLGWRLKSGDWQQFCDRVAERKNWHWAAAVIEK